MALLNPYNYKKPAVPVNVLKKPALKSVRPATPQRIQQDAYLEQKVMSAKPEELTLMLYEGLVKFIKTTMLYIEQGNATKANEMSLRAQAIVSEFRATLNTDYEISKEFDALYIFIADCLINGNISKEIKPYEDALVIAEEMHDTWKQVMKLA